VSTAYTPCARLGPYAVAAETLYTPRRPPSLISRPPLSTAYYDVVSIAFWTQHDAIHSKAPFNTPERGP
jgi:hypothetical protein